MRYFLSGVQLVSNTQATALRYYGILDVLGLHLGFKGNLRRGQSCSCKQKLTNSANN